MVRTVSNRSAPSTNSRQYGTRSGEDPSVRRRAGPHTGSSAKAEAIVAVQGSTSAAVMGRDTADSSGSSIEWDRTEGIPAQRRQSAAIGRPPTRC